MFDYLQQFNSLPADLRAKVSSPEAMKLLSELEAKYQVDLAALVMKVMVKSVAVKNLPAYLAGEFALGSDQAASLATELKQRLFSAASDYLGLDAEQRIWDLNRDIDLIIQEAGLVLPSASLVSRLKNILSTYVRGIRNKIDTKASLAKSIASGGLSLVPAEVDKLIKVCDQKTFTEFSSPSLNIPTPQSSPLDALIKADVAREAYDLKKALLSGETKPVVAAAGVVMGAAPVFSPNRELPNPADLKDFPLPSAPRIDVAEKNNSSVATSEIAQNVATPPKPQEMPVAPLNIVKPASAKTVSPLDGSQKLEPTTPKTAPSRPFTPQIQPSARPKIQDIKPVPKVIGPIEELQLLDSVNFRRLGTNPAEATAKILNKIKLLEKDGYDKMILGVKAWRSSLINRVYLRIFQEAVVKGAPLKDIIEARLKEDKNSLNEEEIDAIITLNSKLVF